MLNSKQLSYYYGKDYTDSIQIIVPFEFIDTKLGVNRSIPFKIDTGAIDTCLNAADLEIDQTEEEFVSTHKVEKVNRYGIAKHIPITYYRYLIQTIKLGDFTLHNFPVFISFNPNATARLIGMSLLKLFDTQINPEFKTITFKETQTFSEYTQGKKSMHNIDRLTPETFVDFGEETLIEANCVNNLAKHPTD